MIGRFTQEDPIGLAGGINLYGFAGGDPVNFSDPFGLCPKDQGGNGKSEELTDCPTNDPEKIKKADEIEKEITGQWMTAIRLSVAGQAVAVSAAAVSGVSALEGAVVRAQLAIINNPAKAAAAGFSAGFAKAMLISGASGAPKPILPSISMARGYDVGERVGTFVKGMMRYYGSY